MLRFFASKCADLSIRSRLAGAFAVVLALTVCMTVTGLAEIAQIDEARHVMKTAASSSALAQRWLGAIEANLARTYAIAKSEDVADRQFFNDAMRKGSADITAIQKRLESQVDEEGRQSMQKAAAERSRYVAIRDKVFALQKSGTSESDLDIIVQAEMVPAMKAYVNAVQAVVAHQDDAFGATNQRIDTVYAQARSWLVGVGTVAVLFGALFAWLLSRSIVHPLSQAVKLAKTVAAGDLTTRIDARSRDEVGELQRALQSMNDSLLQTVRDVRQSSETIASASEEIATGNLDLSTRTETQASSLQETAASLEELTSTVKQNAEHARDASALAVSASSIAGRGGAMVADVVATMAAISASSKRIEDIIGVIDGIAFQTNILALNAAVEAARAGEQGRGFAVVASEVRNLAQRSAGAAKDIKALIGESVTTVEAGSRLVGQTGDTMADIVHAIAQVTALMGQIATATLEQTTGLDQINVAVTQMDDVTQQNAALVEQAAAAAASLDEQAQRLVRAVGVFVTDVAPNPVRARAALAAA